MYLFYYTALKHFINNAVFLYMVYFFLPEEVQHMNTEQSEICPLRLVMDVVGGKWRLSIICLL